MLVRGHSNYFTMAFLALTVSYSRVNWSTYILSKCQLVRCSMYTVYTTCINNSDSVPVPLSNYKCIFLVWAIAYPTPPPHIIIEHRAHYIMVQASRNVTSGVFS